VRWAHDRQRKLKERLQRAAKERATARKANKKR
jgi:hypothetical protein